VDGIEPNPGPKRLYASVDLNDRPRPYRRVEGNMNLDLTFPTTYALDRQEMVNSSRLDLDPVRATYTIRPFTYSLNSFHVISIPLTDIMQTQYRDSTLFYSLLPLMMTYRRVSVESVIASFTFYGDDVLWYDWIVSEKPNYDDCEVESRLMKSDFTEQVKKKIDGQSLHFVLRPSLDTDSIGQASPKKVYWLNIFIDARRCNNRSIVVNLQQKVKFRTFNSSYVKEIPVSVNKRLRRKNRVSRDLSLKNSEEYEAEDEDSRGIKDNLERKKAK